MTTLDTAVEIDRTTTGWLRRAWEIGFANQLTPGRAQCGEERGFLLRGTIAETLEPFVSATPAPGLADGDTRILDFERLDGPAAAALLAELPAPALGLDLSIYAPSTGTMLRVVAENPGVVLAEGSVYSPALPVEAIRPRALTILDPALADVAPDVVPGDLPAWIEELPAHDYAAFLSERQHCLDHGTTRPAWLTAVARYRIGDARRHPDPQLVTDPATGLRGVRFAW
jgi:hypothetical protein